MEHTIQLYKAGAAAELEELRTVLAVEEHGGIARAAEALGITQAGVSKRLARLEGRLGRSLIVSGTRPARLTEEGITLSRALAGFFVEIGLRQSSRERTLRVAAAMVVIASGFLDAVRLFKTSFPECPLEIVAKGGMAAAALLHAGEVDIWVSGMDLRHVAGMRGFRCETLVDSPRCLLVPRGHPLLSRPKVTLRDIAQYPLVMLRNPDPGSSAALLEDMFKAEGVAYEVALRMDDMAPIRRYVQLGLGISVIPRYLVTGPTRSVAVIPLGHLLPSARITVITGLQQPSAPHRAFVSFLHSSLRHQGE